MNDQIQRAAVGGLLTAVVASTMLSAAAARAGTLTVAVTGVRSADGVVRAGAYAASGRRVAAASTLARNSPVTIRFDELPAGRYGVRLYHDANDNGRLDRGAFGLPAEGYGFSNGAVARFGPPAFDKMAVEVGSAPAATTATLRY